MSDMGMGRMDVGPIARDASQPGTPDPGDLTTAAVRVALAAGGPLDDLIREATQEAIRARVMKIADQALTDALTGDLGPVLDEQVELALHDALDGAEPDAGPELVYENVVDWMNDFFLEHYRRPIERGGMRWCPQIWDHTEAVSRLETTWRAWEYMRHQGSTGPAVWWRDYFDPMMRELTSQTGPFHACNARSGEHVVPERWTIVQPPDGLYNGPGHPCT